MLQLPSPSASRRFTKAEIAEITRGAKPQKMRTAKVDPVVALVARADAALDAYTTARLDRWSAEQNVDKDDVFGPVVHIPDDLLNVHWSKGFLFSSEHHIERQFRDATRQKRAALKQHKAQQERLAKIKGITGLNYELQQRIASCERALTLLSKTKEPLKASFRKEYRRVTAIHRKAGLLDAREKVRIATRKLALITDKMKRVKPSSLAGALAVIGYVERRSWCEKQQMFADDGYFPADLGQLLRRALAVLKKAVSQ